MIGIRADANSIVGAGHLMRCITIAKAILEKEEAVTFFVADSQSQRLLEGNLKDDRVQCVVLGTDFSDMEAELPVLTGELKRRNIEVILVDSYRVTYNYFDELKKTCVVAYMDDLLDMAYPLDVVINYSGYSINMGYSKAYDTMKGHLGEKTKLLLGLKYAPLREQFYTDCAPVVRKKEEKFEILVATGGADTCDMLLPLAGELEKIATEGKTSYHVVIGDYVKDAEEVEKAIGSMHGMTAHRSVKNMADLMKRCAMAVVAAGTMLTECAALGLPTVFYQVADNQKFNVDFWGKTGGMIFVGDVSPRETDGDIDVINKKKTVIKNICDEIKILGTDKTALDTMSGELKNITDGKGALRIAEVLVAAK
jgi:UDP-2,4-diacetamido-2,4,6-trideoxy-beta-L-altropyranose hydrolase